jgi:hypothetical protein
MERISSTNKAFVVVGAAADRAIDGTSLLHGPLQKD